MDRLKRSILFAAATTGVVFCTVASANECRLSSAGFTSEHPVSVKVDADNTVAPHRLIARDREVRVSAFISAEDAARLIDAMGLDVPVDPDGNGEVTLSHLVTRERRSIATGSCAGQNTKEYMTAVTMLLLGKDAKGDFNIPFVSSLTDAPVPVTDYHDANADIDMTVRNYTEKGIRRLAIATRTVSKGGEFDVSIDVAIIGDLRFTPNSADLKAAHFPIYGRRSNGIVDRIWCSPVRERARFKVGDRQLVTANIRTGEKGLCFNQLVQADGNPICVSLLKNNNGSVKIADVRIYRYAGLKCEIHPYRY